MGAHKKYKNRKWPSRQRAAKKYPTERYEQLNEYLTQIRSGRRSLYLKDIEEKGIHDLNAFFAKIDEEVAQEMKEVEVIDEDLVSEKL